MVLTDGSKIWLHLTIIYKFSSSLQNAGTMVVMEFKNCRAYTKAPQQGWLENELTKRITN